MELGIGPIVTSGLIMQLLSGSKLMDFDPSVQEDRELFGVIALGSQPQLFVIAAP